MTPLKVPKTLWLKDFQTAPKERNYQLGICC